MLSRGQKVDEKLRWSHEPEHGELPPSTWQLGAWKRMTTYSGTDSARRDGSRSLPVSAVRVVVSSRMVLLGVGVAALLVNLANAIVIATGLWQDPELEDVGPWMLLSEENNPSTWLAAILLAGSAGLALLLGLAHRDSRVWVPLAAVLGLLSLDEVASVHERAGYPLERVDLPTYGWLVAGVGALVVLAVFLRRPVSRLPAELRIALAGAASVFLLGAVGVEALGGWWDHTRGIDTWYQLLATVEENLELAGATLVLRALLRHTSRIGDIVGRVVLGQPDP